MLAWDGQKGAEMGIYLLKYFHKSFWEALKLSSPLFYFSGHSNCIPHRSPTLTLEALSLAGAAQADRTNPFLPHSPPPWGLELQRPQAHLGWISETASDPRPEMVSVHRGRGAEHFLLLRFFDTRPGCGDMDHQKIGDFNRARNLNSQWKIGIGRKLLAGTTRGNITWAIPYISWPQSYLATAWGGINTFQKKEEPARAEEEPAIVWDFARPNSKQILPWRSAKILYCTHTFCIVWGNFV